MVESLVVSMEKQSVDKMVVLKVEISVEQKVELTVVLMVV
jgi:hypothetical protein